MIEKAAPRIAAARIAALCLCVAAHAALAQEYFPPDKPPPADWEVQGEYFGSLADGSGKLGAWVIGLGGDKFDVVFLPGGLLDLPGQEAGGWDKTTRIAANGTAAGIKGSGYQAAITGNGTDRTMAGTDNAGKAFTLKHVMRRSPTLGLKPKAGWNAESWFRFNTPADLSNWSPKPDAPQLKFGGYLYRGVTCKLPHQATFLHIEFMTTYCPTCTGQNRGNSGIYLRGMHEMQVLDSFGLTGAFNEMGAIYRTRAPLVNAALPPLSWQTYDCWYTPGAAPHSATFTVYLNGVLVQDKTPVDSMTQAGFEGTSLYLQAHGHDVVYNNIWAVPNATVATLPWETLLAPVAVRSPVRPAAQAASRGGVDASGRDISRAGPAGHRRRIQPVFSR